MGNWGVDYEEDYLIALVRIGKCWKKCDPLGIVVIEV